jgi:hypothetical protein
MAGGRPSKYSAHYCGEVIATASEGRSIASFAARIGVARSTVFKWAEDIPEFSDALNIARAKAAEFWEGELIKLATTGQGNAAAVIFALKNRAADDWREKVINEHSGPDGGPIETAELSDKEKARRLAFLLAKGAQSEG